MALYVTISIIGTLLLILFIPMKGAKRQRYRVPATRYHEADAVLSRRRLIPGTDEYRKYYQQNPGYQETDDLARGKPGLLSKDSKYFSPGTYAAAEAGFILTDHLHTLSGLEKNSEITEVDASNSTAFIKQWMLQSGAHSIGITSLEDHHIYSHKGRGPQTGREIMKDLPHAIAITVEMDHNMMKPAPAGTTVMESAEQYLNSAILATKLTAYIKQLGYSAKAHIDGNYEVICPLVAADAGLGVIGRMGLLMTPSLGPRVRIAVITTDLPLVYDTDEHDLTVLDFCEQCKKCARVCPADAVPHDTMQEIEGIPRWKIHSEACYLFWTISGTDCGKCVISCPYAHPDNRFHRFVRWSIKNNLVFRWMAVKLDDVFYGKKPPMGALPHWTKLKN